MLYPVESESRECKDLGGIWGFRADPEGTGYDEKWHLRPLTETIPMPVPSSYNDVTQDTAIRDHIGSVWYDRLFYVPRSWEGGRIVLRFGSVTHRAIVWVNGREIARHLGGFLPFEAEISEHVAFGAENRLTVAVSNVLDFVSLPHGTIHEFDDDLHPPGYRELRTHGDIFNYAGIHRPVTLYCTPRCHIAGIAVETGLDGATGTVKYSATIEGGSGKEELRVELVDDAGREVARASGIAGKMRVSGVCPWEPGAPYLYTLVAKLSSGDTYRLPVGVRTVAVEGDQFLINGKPFFFRGFGKHEDWDVRGRGIDPVMLVKDMNLLRWCGANSFRTSHYPYAEEIVRLADREGIVIIGEAPALSSWIPQDKKDQETYEATREYHAQVMRELIARDRNSPSVVMWSVANEVDTGSEAAERYFKEIIEVTRKADPTRPVTIVGCIPVDQCRVSSMVDVVSVNRYFGWYTDSGHLDLIEHQVDADLRRWHERFGKPVLLSEFGADTIAGLHQDPPVMFTEEYQVELLRRTIDAAERLPFVVGTHVWNFADFNTKQGVRRVDGNKKGVFTRDRRPKMAAHYLRERWGKGAGE
ncbi:MAG: beta-glucuronidase [Chitinivibrionales bacterium]|nr:beta-glucuronidase [Chitinivibrionales bacterium]